MSTRLPQDWYQRFAGLLSKAVQLGVAVAVVYLICLYWIWLEQPAWPAPKKVSTETYDHRKVWPEATVVDLGEYVCRMRNEEFTPVKLVLTPIRQGEYRAFEGTVNYRIWSEGYGMAQVYIKGPFTNLDGKKELAGSGGTAPRGAGGEESYRVEWSTDQPPGKYPIWVEMTHPRGDEPSIEELRNSSGGEVYRVKTIIAEGELIVLPGSGGGQRR